MSSILCRPIRLQFIHEKNAEHYKKSRIHQRARKKLVSFETVLDGKDISIFYKNLHLQ